MIDERFLQQMKFVLEVDKLKDIGRQTYVSNGKRKENDAEHSWHLALMAYILKEYSNEDIDVLKVILMVLIHDIVEIDAGDTYAYDEEGYKTKAIRENAAADRLFGLLPKDQGEYFKALWQEFEAGETMEAKYANSLDRLQPMMLNDATDGIAWVEHSVTREKVRKRYLTAKQGSETMWEYGQYIIDKNVKKGRISE